MVCAHFPLATAGYPIYDGKKEVKLPPQFDRVIPIEELWREFQNEFRLKPGPIKSRLHRMGLDEQITILERVTAVG